MDLFSHPGALFNQSFKGSPFIVQVTYFACGGIAITGIILHKVGDACTQFGFINDWVAVASGGKASPMFIPSLISPFSSQTSIPQVKLENDKIVRSRYSFNASKIAELKAVVADLAVHNPTQAQVVSALIYRCAMAAAKEKLGMSRPSILMHTVNLQPLVVQRLPENSVGKFSWFFAIMSKDESDKRLHTIANAMKKQHAEFCKRFDSRWTLLTRMRVYPNSNRSGTRQ